MRLIVASSTCHWIFSLLLINNSLIIHGLKKDEKKRDFGGKTSSVSKSFYNDKLMNEYSYPKNEVTAGVGYGHHLHPLYYRGEREMMYPCAVECDEWEAMSLEDNSNDASSNVEVVTVHPDVSTIDITTPKVRFYKDISFLRPKKYKSSSSSSSYPILTTTTSIPKTMRNNNNDFNYHEDSKAAGLQIIPLQTSRNRYFGESFNNYDKEIPNDGSLYAKYYDAMIKGDYKGEKLNNNNNNNNNNENFDPMEESIKYNPPSFDDGDNYDIEAPVYPTIKNSNPKREKIKESFEDVKSNSFGSSGEDENYSTDNSILGKENNDSYDALKYLDDYAAPIKPFNRNENYQGGLNGEKPFRTNPDKHSTHGVYSGYVRGKNNNKNKIPLHGFNGYSNYQVTEDYGVEKETDDNRNPLKSGRYSKPAFNGNYNIKQGGRYYGKKYPQERVRDPRIIGRPFLPYDKTRKDPHKHRSQFLQLEHSKYHPKPAGSYSQNLYSENGEGNSANYHPYAPRHEYFSEIQEYPIRSNSAGGIKVVSPPRIRAPPPSRHGNLPHYYMNGNRNRSYIRGERLNYKQMIPQRDGFIKILKKYKSFVDHTPKRYVGSGEPYVTH